MATPSSEEIQEFYDEEIEYKDSQNVFEEAYVEEVIEGNASDD